MSKPAKEGEARGSLKRRHLGIAGLLTVLLQYGVGVKNEKTTTDVMHSIASQEMAKVQAQLGISREERERDFVRKSDFSLVLNRIEDKLDKFDTKLDHQNSKISRIEGYLKSDHADLGSGRSWSSR